MRVLLCVLLALAVAGCSPKAGKVEDPDVTGTWVLDLKSSDLKPTPKEIDSFALKVNGDGTFQATHLPAHLFSYERPAQEELSGKWHLKHDSRDDVFYFSLDFDSVDGQPQEQSAILKWRDGNKSGKPPEDLVLRYYVAPEPGNSRGSVEFCLIKKQ